MPTKCCWVIHGSLTSERKASTSPSSFIYHSTLLLDRALKCQAPCLHMHFEARALDRLRTRRRVGSTRRRGNHMHDHSRIQRKAGPFKFFVSRQRPHWFLKNPRKQNKPAYIACSPKSRLQLALAPPAVYVHGRGFVRRTARPASDHEKALSAVHTRLQAAHYTLANEPMNRSWRKATPDESHGM